MAIGGGGVEVETLDGSGVLAPSPLIDGGRIDTAGGRLLAGHRSEPEDGPFTIWAKASVMSRADWKRWLRSRARAFWKKSSSSTGSSGTTSVARGSGSARIMPITSPTISLSNGSFPVTAWKVITPRDQRSLRWSMSRTPRTASGLM